MLGWSTLSTFQRALVVLATVLVIACFATVGVPFDRPPTAWTAYFGQLFLCSAVLLNPACFGGKVTTGWNGWPLPALVVGGLALAINVVGLALFVVHPTF